MVLIYPPRRTEGCVVRNGVVQIPKFDAKPVVKASGVRGFSPPAPIWVPCNSMSPPDWIYKVLFYAQITPKYLGVEWVWGLLQYGFVRWAPLLHMNTLTTAINLNLNITITITLTLTLTLILCLYISDKWSITNNWTVKFRNSFIPYCLSHYD